jgi:hypothetical protein
LNTSFLIILLQREQAEWDEVALVLAHTGSIEPVEHVLFKPHTFTGHEHVGINQAQQHLTRHCGHRRAGSYNVEEIKDKQAKGF